MIEKLRINLQSLKNFLHKLIFKDHLKIEKPKLHRAEKKKRPNLIKNRLLLRKEKLSNQLKALNQRIKLDKQI